MDPCPDESLLIRWVAGELPAPQRDALDRHAAQCDACRSRRTELQHVWDAAGELEFLPPPRDLTDAVLAAARQSIGRTRTPASVYALRLAAAVALAAGLGTVAGRLLPPAAHESPATAVVSEDELLDRTGLHLLAGDNVIIAHVLEVDSADGPNQEEAS